MGRLIAAPIAAPAHLVFWASSGTRSDAVADCRSARCAPPPRRATLAAPIQISRAHPPKRKSTSMLASWWLASYDPLPWPQRAIFYLGVAFFAATREHLEGTSHRSLSMGHAN